MTAVRLARSRGENEQERIPEPQRLLGADHPGLVAAPADQQVRLGTGGLDALDHLDRPHDAGQEPPPDLLDRPVSVGPPAAKPLDGNQVQTADSDSDGGQKRVTGEHDGHVDHQGQQADRRGRQLARDQSGHSRRARRPADEIAGPPMLKKRDRQPQDVPHESDRLDQRQPDLEARQIDLLQTGRGEPKRGRHGHGPEQRLEPGVVPLDQDLIDEDALKRGQHEVGNHQGQPGQNHEDERGLGGREPPDQTREPRWASCLP